jgi:hypothetical protein
MKVMICLFLSSTLAFAASIVSTIDAPAGDISGLAWNGSSLWTVDHTNGCVYRLDPSSGAVIFSFHPDLSSSYPPQGMAAMNDTLFVSFVKAGTGAGVQGMYSAATGAFLGTVYFC